MIQANELRIGNLCRDNVSKELLRVAGLNDEGNIVFSVINRDKYPLPDGWQAEPIPLTPEILISCGFFDPAKNGMAYRIGVNSVDELCWHKQDGELRYQTKGSGFTRNFGRKHFHELQNLFYFLTSGSELSINLEKVKV